MNEHSGRAGALAGCLCLALAAAPGALRAHGTGGAAADPHAAHRAPPPGTSADVAEVEIHDLPLIDQDGRELRFASEVVADKLVVLSVMYTTCTTVCPVTSAIFAQLQQRLGPRLGDDVRLVLLSVDPATDTPSRLKQQAAKFDARPGWLWLTGGKRVMDVVLDGIGAYATNFRDHPTVVLVGNGRTGTFKRLFGFPAPDDLLAEIDRLDAGAALGRLDPVAR